MELTPGEFEAADLAVRAGSTRDMLRASERLGGLVAVMPQRRIDKMMRSGQGRGGSVTVAPPCAGTALTAHPMSSPMRQDSPSWE
jgi:hypothetical protein